jgi:hypothetical protein
VSGGAVFVCAGIGEPGRYVAIQSGTVSAHTADPLSFQRRRFAVGEWFIDEASNCHRRVPLDPHLQQLEYEAECCAQQVVHIAASHVGEVGSLATEP